MTSIDTDMTVNSDNFVDRMGSLLRLMTKTGGAEDPLHALSPEGAPEEELTPTTEETQTDDMSLPDDFVSPTLGSFPIASPFGPRKSGFHGGVDISTPVGTQLVSAISGTVTHAANDDPGGYGNWVEISGPGGISIRYGHMASIGVKVGQKVTPGARIGKSGGAKGAEGAGNSDGPHVHFEVRKSGTAIDPSSYIGGAGTVQATGDDMSMGMDPVVPNEPPSSDSILGASMKNLVDVAGDDPLLTGQRANTDLLNPQGDVGIPTDDMPIDTKGGMEGYYSSVLKMIGAPITPANLKFMKAWQQAEGGDATNPFNTTQDAPGATNFNSVGVKRYPNAKVGANATAKTLMNGMYANIIAALKQGKDPMAAARALANSPWGTGELTIKVLGG